MAFPLAIAFHGLAHSSALEAWIRRWADKLERVYERIEAGEVVVEQPARHHRKGRQFRVRVRLRVPGADVVVDREPGIAAAHEDPFVAVRDTFAAARRQLEDHARILRGDVKTRAWW
jgi:hypothetical protein